MEEDDAAALLRRCFERSPTQRPTAANLADAFASDVREGVEGPSPTLERRLADQEAITEEVTRVNSRLTQDNARLQREVEALVDVRRQERALQGNVQQLTQDNAFLQRANTWKCRGGRETACAELDSILGLGLGWFTSRAVPLELSLARHVDEEAHVDAAEHLLCPTPESVVNQMV